MLGTSGTFTESVRRLVRYLCTTVLVLRTVSYYQNIVVRIIAMVSIPILNRHDSPQSVRERHLSFTESESLNRKWSRWTTYLSAWFTAWNNLNTADEKLAVVADYIHHPAEVTGRRR